MMSGGGHPGKLVAAVPHPNMDVRGRGSRGISKPNGIRSSLLAALIRVSLAVGPYEANACVDDAPRQRPHHPPATPSAFLPPFTCRRGDRGCTAEHHSLARSSCSSGP